MKKVVFALIFLTAFISLKAQLYFPPKDSSHWETLDPIDLGWCFDGTESLFQFLESNNTRAFILLKDGKIVLEKYFGSHTQSSPWYWASAGKTLTSFLVGIAQQENSLSISDTVSRYLGAGWTSLEQEQEEKIKIRHLISMTSGLDDGVENPHCTDDTCLVYKAEPGTRWAYHNAPYTLLDPVLENATGVTLNTYVAQKLQNVTGITGLYLKQGYNNVFFSNARSMARFGLLILNGGNWNGHQVLTDTAFFNQMVHTSQPINKSYGYLWWLNGKESFMLPGFQMALPGMLIPDAPPDLYAALGKNGQFINVVPELNMVWIRMGDAPGDVSVPYLLNNQIWQYLNNLPCSTVAAVEKPKAGELTIFPNPADTELNIHIPADYSLNELSLRIFNLQGQILKQVKPDSHKVLISIAEFPAGTYFMVVEEHGNITVRKVRKK
jgi:CubicO group peptidase (beta-lactamase class C family)